MSANTKGSSSADLFRSGNWDDLKPYEMAPWYPIYVMYFAIRALFKKHAIETAAGLAFITAVAVVPLLSIVFSLLAVSGVLTGGEIVVPFIEQLFPASSKSILVYLAEFAESNAGTAAGIGVVAYLCVGLLLFQGIERAFNRIWLSTKQWSLSHNLIAAPSLLILGPVFLGLSFAMTGYVQLRLNQIGVSPSIVTLTVPFITGFLVFFVTNYFLPRHKVRWYAAFVGGLFTAVAFEAVKWGFNLYIVELVFEPFERLYGEVGLFPMFLILLFTTWFIILLGVELAYTTQNLRTLLSINAAEKRDPLRNQARIYNPFIGIELYSPIARAFKSGDGPITERQLVEQTGYGSNVIREVISTLSDVGALNIVHDETTGETTLIPSKQLDDIWLLPIVESFFDFEARPNSLPLDHLYSGFRAVVMDTLHAQSALTLVPRTIANERTARRESIAHLSQPRDDLRQVLDEAPLVDPLPDAPPATRRAPTEDSSFNNLPDKPLRGTQALGSMQAAEESAISVESQDIIVADYGKSPEPISIDEAAESVEIDVSDWDDISIEDSLSDIDGPDENDLRRTSEIDIETELGDELSSPPPVPDEKP